MIVEIRFVVAFISIFVPERNTFITTVYLWAMLKMNFSSFLFLSLFISFLFDVNSLILTELGFPSSGLLTKTPVVSGLG